MPQFEPKSVDQLAPPYTYYNKLQEFISKLEALPYIPSSVDEILNGFPQSTANTLRSTLRYLRLVDVHLRPSEELKRLIQARGEQRQQEWRAILTDAYPYLLGSEAYNFDVTNATRQQLEERFQAAGVTKRSSVERAVNFFRLAARAAGILPSLNGAEYHEEIKYHEESEEQANPSNVGVDKMIGEQRVLDPITDPKSSNGGSKPPPPKVQILPSLPEYDPTWAEDIRKMWFEMRLIELKRGR